MKKILVIMLALAMIFSFVACGGGSDDTSGGGDEPTVSGHTPSTDYFYDKYDYAEEWMIPDDGVYTGYTFTSADSNEAGNEFISARIYDIDEDGIAAYVDKVLSHGYEDLGVSDAYTKQGETGTVMIQINNYLEDGYIDIIIDPSI